MMGATMVKLNNRIHAFALGFALLASTGLSVAFAENGAVPTDSAKQGHGWHQHGGMHKGCGVMKQLNLTEDQKKHMQEGRKAFREQNAAAIASIKAKYQQLKQLGKDPANDAQRQQLRTALK